ncbi:hypothetical protein M1271_06585 [Patescibacteria group bacterium]|nr:hypothetical protein [Patescibacteria group bacterium]
MNYSEDIIYLQIAGFVLKIIFERTEWPRIKRSIQRDILFYCGGFRIYKVSKVDYTMYFIQRKNNEVFSKQEKGKNFINLYESADDEKIVTFYQISIIHFLFILRIIFNKLLSKGNGFILHSSASFINNKAYLFLGDEGTGKSTAIKLLKSVFPPLEDDMSIIRREKGKFYFYQTPYLEKNEVKKSNKAYLVGKVFYVMKDKTIHVKKIYDKELILNKILTQIVSGKEELEKCLKEIIQFVHNYDFYYLYFNLNSKELIKHFQYGNSSYK